mmetsp:Transcript_26025/g.76283  ORF Transcript_26025/g.76283 Transcript_26025/m.76283 type:complete len:122 (-) Transcript_26025:61-426(-)
MAQKAMFKQRESLFRRKYPMSKKVFRKLVDKLEPHIQNAGASRGAMPPGGAIPVDLKVGAFLRWMAGGSYLDIAPAHAMSTVSLFRIIDDSLKAVCAHIGDFDLTDETILDVEFLRKKSTS